MVLKSPLPEVEIPEVPFAEYIFQQLDAKKDGVGYIEASTNTQFTHGQVKEKSVKLASALTKHGLGRQEIVAVCISNSIYYPIIILGTASCNAIMSPCNPNYTYEELVKQFKLCDPKFVITDEKQMKKMQKVASQVKSIKKIFTVHESKFSDDSVAGMIERDNGKDYPTKLSVDCSSDVVMLPYSSGTTGMPKGVMLTHRNVVAIQALCRMGPMPDGLVHCHVLPLFHAYGLAYMFMTSGQIPFVIMQRFDVTQFCRCVEKYKITSLGGVPAVLAELSKSDIPAKYDLSSLGVIGSGAAALSPKIAENTMNRMNVAVVQGWGLTECTVITSNAIPGAGIPADSVGLVMANTTIKVVHPESGRELVAGQNGEILVKGPQVMKGYYRNDEQNRNAFDTDGWFRTGDVGHYDDDGFVYLVDRLKELIKYKGFQVPPAELEGIIVGHPEVADCGVVGVKDDEAGEVPRAYVVRDRGSKVTEQQIKDYLHRQVISYKQLRGGVEFVTSIPRNPTGKILRRHLRQLANKKSKL